MCLLNIRWFAFIDILHKRKTNHILNNYPPHRGSLNFVHDLDNRLLITDTWELIFDMWNFVSIFELQIDVQGWRIELDIPNDQSTHVHHNFYGHPHFLPSVFAVFEFEVYDVTMGWNFFNKKSGWYNLGFPWVCDADAQLLLVCACFERCEESIGIYGGHKREQV